MPTACLHAACCHSLQIVVRNACHVEPFGDIDNGTPLKMTVNVLHPENGDGLQSLTFCEILLPHVSRGCLLIGGSCSLHRSLKPVCQSWTLFCFFLWL